MCKVLIQKDQCLTHDTQALNQTSIPMACPIYGGLFGVRLERTLYTATEHKSSAFFHSALCIFSLHKVRKSILHTLKHTWLKKWTVS